MWKNSENRCPVCQRLYCCVKCRLFHQINHHPSHEENCGICRENGPVLLIPDLNILNPAQTEIMSSEISSTTNIYDINKDAVISEFLTRFLDHVATAHLPLHCVKCLQVFLTREDLSRPANRCDGHTLDRHSALEHVRKSQILNSPVETNNNIEDQSIELNKKSKSIVYDVNSPTIDDASSLCQSSIPKNSDQVQDTKRATSTPMARSSSSTIPVSDNSPHFHSPHVDSQVSDIASPSSDIEVFQSESIQTNKKSCKKQTGILFKGIRTPGIKKNKPRVHFAATPITERLSNSSKRIIKYTPKRKYITNPRFQEIRMRFESYGIVSDNTNLETFIPPKLPSNELKHEPQLKLTSTVQDVSSGKDEGIQTPPLISAKFSSTSSIKEPSSTSSSVYHTGIETPITGVQISTPASNIALGPTPCGPGGVLMKPRSQFPDILERYPQDSPETYEEHFSSTELIRTSTTIWGTPMNSSSDGFRLSSIKPGENDSPFDNREIGEEGSDSLFEDDNVKTNQCSGSLWGSVTGAAKNILHNIHGLVLGGGSTNTNKSKRPRCASIGPTSTNSGSPLRALKRSKSGDASNFPAVMMEAEFQNKNQRFVMSKFSRIKGRRPISDRFKKTKSDEDGNK